MGGELLPCAIAVPARASVVLVFPRASVSSLFRFAVLFFIGCVNKPSKNTPIRVKWWVRLSNDAASQLRLFFCCGRLDSVSNLTILHRFGSINTFPAPRGRSLPLNFFSLSPSPLMPFLLAALIIEKINMWLGYQSVRRGEPMQIYIELSYA